MTIHFHIFPQLCPSSSGFWRTSNVALTWLEQNEMIAKLWELSCFVGKKLYRPQIGNEWINYGPAVDWYEISSKQVKNKAPAPVQITAEQLLREAKERQLEIVPPVSIDHITYIDFKMVIQMLFLQQTVHHITNLSMIMMIIEIFIQVQTYSVP